MRPVTDEMLMAARMNNKMMVMGRQLQVLYA